ncbi:MAG: hypothetical protein K0R34_3090 [Herbinix sp.]|jgi:hypothetical protein|nr:hypothetical protein [Herbinix sp.]
MGLLEYLFERKNPGTVGEIQKNQPPLETRSVAWVVLKLIISIVIICGLFYITVLQDFSFGRLLIYILTLTGYSIICYRYVPRPDTSNMGLFGGIIDNPFRYTDDLNRFLMFLSILLYPGRFISTTLVQTYRLIKGIRKK